MQVEGILEADDLRLHRGTPHYYGAQGAQICIRAHVWFAFKEISVLRINFYF